ncbi:MAG: hypothetical protein KC560_02440 [Myxococcales bacterium]|nr:hypothetical protein [Myxococcales bacterium]
MSGPAIVGVGQVLQRTEDARAADEPLALMRRALARAGEDAGAPGLLARATAIYVVRGAWRYGDAGRALAATIGARVVESVSTPYGGNFAQACVIDAARAVAAGRCEVAVVVGAENGRSSARARRAGETLAATDVPGAPDRILGVDKPLFHEAEIARGMNSASDVFSIVGSALRRARGESIDANRDRIAALWARFAAVASDNPHAWIRSAPGAAAIRDAGPDNPMISFPYTRLMNANARVDMAAAVVVCSREAAERAGVPREKAVFLHAASEANDGNYLSERAELHRSPAMRIAGARALAEAGVDAARVEHVDLYSCFPSAVQVAAAELGLSEERALTVTGGLTFGGGPLNHYGLHAVARMVEVLRADRGARGLVSGNGGWLAKHSFGVYGAAPPERGFRYACPQGEVDRVALREARVDAEGACTIEGYTVAHAGGEPRRAIAACLTDDGRRTWGVSEDPDVLRAMMRDEHCGARARLDGRGGLRIA